MSSRPRIPEIDWNAVGAGAVWAIAIEVVTLVAFRIVDATSDVGCESNVGLLFFVPLVAGWVIAGQQAAKRQPSAPFTHGLVAALAGLAVLIAIRLTLGAFVDDDSECTPGLAQYVFYVMVATSAGIFGGLFATRRPSPNPPRP